MQKWQLAASCNLWSKAATTESNEAKRQTVNFAELKTPAASDAVSAVSAQNGNPQTVCLSMRGMASLRLPPCFFWENIFPLFLQRSKRLQVTARELSVLTVLSTAHAL